MEAGERRILVAASTDEVAEVAASAQRAGEIALDVEANGLFAYRARLCVLQIAWRSEGGVVAAIIDPFRADLAALGSVLGAGGPVKVLHDLTFDARMLGEAGLPLERVRDTSVAARLLGHEATGLAALLGSELGVTITKRFQQYDWAARPLAPEHVAYLAGDVLHLLDLDAKLGERVEALGIAAEVADECDYKLATAGGPPRDARPAYVRIKGAAELDAAGRAVLRRLVEAREIAAEAADVPPFKVIGNDVLLELSRRRPTSVADVRAVRGASVGRAAGLTRAWLAAIVAGLDDADVPDEDRASFERVPVDRVQIGDRRAREAQITAWRRAEAKLRGVCEQVVLPGHVAQSLVALLTTPLPGDEALRASIAAIPGFGRARFERYEGALLALAAEAPKSGPKPAPTP